MSSSERRDSSWSVSIHASSVGASSLCNMNSSSSPGLHVITWYILFCVHLRCSEWNTVKICDKKSKDLRLKALLQMTEHISTSRMNQAGIMWVVSFSISRVVISQSDVLLFVYYFLCIFHKSDEFYYQIVFIKTCRILSIQINTLQKNIQSIFLSCF